MSGKIILSLVALIFIATIVIPILFKKEVGDIGPAILPPKLFESSASSSIQAVGEAAEFPIKVPAQLKIGIFAKGLGSPRDLEFSPGGVLLASIPRQNRVAALPDKNNDGIVDEVKDVLTGVENVHGLAFYQDKLFVAGETTLRRYSWDENNLKATLEKELFKIPSEGGHITRTIAFNSKGQMFVSIGSTCNVCEESHDWFASVIVSDTEGNNPKVYSKGLRNATFITKHPTSDDIWVTEMGRDQLGDNIPPEEINILKENADFGWPYCFDDRIHDDKFDTAKRRSCDNTQLPTFKMQAHSAPLGLAFITSDQFPKEWQGDLLVSFHGSWNRSVATGYKVVRLDVEGNTIKGQEDFITGFLEDGSSQAMGRPVDVIFDKMGSLYVSDDKAGNVYKIVKK
jgi:glucose/arabinose dehydrogenase